MAKQKQTTSRSRRYATHWNTTPFVYILRPMQDFIRQSQAGGIVLLLTTILALLIANSPWGETYESLLATHISLHVGPWLLDESVLHWVNDGLMVIFFFVVGLEIKRELMVGELSNMRAATLPIVAALGGVLVPALIYTAFTWGEESVRGWAVPTATDIAFALGCLALLGNRVPFGIKVFLTAVAIVDDLIAVLVIAIFYSSDLNLMALGVGLGVLLLLLIANLSGFRNPVIYGGLGIIVWLSFLNSGVHATIAGVLLALTIPARSRVDGPTYLMRVRQVLQQVESSLLREPSKQSTELQESAVRTIEQISEQAQAPLQRLEHKLHTMVAFVIMPVFAFANAGVAISTDSLNTETAPVMLGIILGLTIGKPIGIFGASWLAVRSGMATLPLGSNWQHLVSVGVLAGIGFTMSIFIASLAFISPLSLASAKLSILVASTVAGSLGVFLLSRASAPKQD